MALDQEALDRVSERVGRLIDEPKPKDEPKQKTDVIEDELNQKDPDEGGEHQEDPIEAKARKSGWLPKEEFIAAKKGHADDWVSAKEYTKRGELYDSIKALKASKDEEGKLVKSLLAENKRMMEILRKDKVKELENDRDAAIELADKAEVKRIDKELKEVEKELSPTAVKEAAKEAEPEMVEWVKENSDWFNKNKKMTQEAIAIYQVEMENAEGEVTLPEILSKVRKKIVRLYPDHFDDEPKKPKDEEPRRRASVEVPGRSNVAGPRKKGWGDLDEAAKTIGRGYVKRGVYKTNDEYALAYFEANGA